MPDVIVHEVQVLFLRNHIVASLRHVRVELISKFSLSDNKSFLQTKEVIITAEKGAIHDYYSSDPNSESPPNFMLDVHKFSREAVMYDRTGMSEQRAAEILLEG